MSQMKKTLATIVEPLSFEETPLEKYKPAHPAIAYLEEVSVVIKTDHLEDYVEVNPYETRNSSPTPEVQTNSQTSNAK